MIITEIEADIGQLHTALKSFRKFVPNQVILNILKYNREAVSHLSSAKVTVMFQDIQVKSHLLFLPTS